MSPRPLPGGRSQAGEPEAAMLHSAIQPDIPLGSIALPGDPPSVVERPRAVHARLLETAAARRRRAAERRGCQRDEDAAYWIEVAPAAVAKAWAIRTRGGFAALP